LAKLYLHVGFHKTGTTSLQDNLNRNRPALLAQGIDYPKTRKFKAHHEFAWSAGQRGWGWKKFGGSKAGSAPAKRMYQLLRKSKLDAIISSEFLSELSPDQIRTLLSSIGRRELKVIFTVRPIAKILPSAYQQEVKNGSKLTYKSWLELVLEPEKENRNKTRFWDRHSHDVEIAKWADIVGKDRVSVIISDDANPDFLTTSFFSLLGVSTKKFKESKKDVINRSMDLAEIELLRRINEQFDRNQGWDEYVSGIRSTLVKTWTQRKPSELSPGRLSTPESFRSLIDARVLKLTEGLRSLGVEITGDLDSLSKAQYGSYEVPAVIEIDNLVDPILSRTRLTALRSYKPSELIAFGIRAIIREQIARVKALLKKNSRAV